MKTENHKSKKCLQEKVSSFGLHLPVFQEVWQSWHNTIQYDCTVCK